MRVLIVGVACFVFGTIALFVGLFTANGEALAAGLLMLAAAAPCLMWFRHWHRTPPEERGAQRW